MLFPASLLLPTFFLTNQVLAVSPPSSLVIVIPSNTSGIGNGTNLPLGMADGISDRNIYWGLHRLVKVSVTYPNGTNRPVVGIGSLDDPTECRTFPGTAEWGFFGADQNGGHKARWDITYGISTSPSQIDEATQNCGPEPLSLQNFTLEHAFEVSLTGDTPGDVPVATETRPLGSQPTGNL
ncbi:hypothetical protein V5O48_001446 [Marasmius crinis-equi]|uniref:Uncharacterized protein n=1 Tax=Marasmius crinis-equi TaxID=585013 RepID=A0ABR3FYU3_9AGAR